MDHASVGPLRRHRLGGDRQQARAEILDCQPELVVGDVVDDAFEIVAGSDCHRVPTSCFQFDFGEPEDACHVLTGEQKAVEIYGFPRSASPWCSTANLSSWRNVVQPSVMSSYQSSSADLAGRSMRTTVLPSCSRSEKRSAVSRVFSVKRFGVGLSGGVDLGDFVVESRRTPSRTNVESATGPRSAGQSTDGAATMDTSITVSLTRKTLPISALHGDGQ